jgi:hypothetical protein
MVELALAYINAPEIQIKSKFALAYFSRLLNVQIHKGFSQGLPLKLDFFKNLFLEEFKTACK